MKIVIIRHGQTEANIMNANGISYFMGALENNMTQLTEKGRNDAKKLINDKDVLSIDKVYSSDLGRAYDTAVISKPNSLIHKTPELRERTHGDFEGLQEKELLEIDEYKKYIYDDNFKKWRKSFTQHAPNGESYDDVSNRCRQFLERLDLQSDEVIGIYSHFHVIRCLFLNLFNIQPKERIFRLHIEHCVPYVVEGRKLGKMKLVSHNLEEMLKKD